MHSSEFNIFLVVPPGLESVAADEAREKGFASVKATAGGVEMRGGWEDVWRANLILRGASRVLAQFDQFRVDHLAKLDKRARRVDWGALLNPNVPVKIDASCRKSRIYHSGAAAERIARAISETVGAPILDDAALTVRARFDHDICTLSVDTSGDLLHKRGHKQAVAKAPLRETMAALLLRACAYRGNEPVLDPMCGSGTFVIEAAEIASGLQPGRTRHFAFEHLATFNAEAWQALRRAQTQTLSHTLTFYGSDRDAGAIRMSRDNAERSGVADITSFTQSDVGDLIAPEGPPGLVIMNPPYGLRIGDNKRLIPLYRMIGDVMRKRFAGWRVAVLTTDKALAKATGLPFKTTSAPIAHGGIRVTLFQTAPLSTNVREASPTQNEDQ